MAIQEAVPDRLGPYRLLDRIGEGGMGLVYLAADPDNRLVAIKVLRSQIAGDATARGRLAREVETMRRVRSPFVAEVVDADVTGPVPYIVTRYVRGRTLEQVVEQGGPRRGPQLQRLAYGLAAALSAVHAAGVVHRDLKPGNVMMVGDEPVVIDFGIAQAGDTTTRLTETGMFVGTPGYLAPEVIGGMPSGQSSDVHSWGATVAFAATGKPPFGTGTFEVVFFRILHGNPYLAGIPGGLYPLVAAALTREPSQRPSAAWLAGRVARLDLTASAQARQAEVVAGQVGAGVHPGPPLPKPAIPFPAAGPRAGPVPSMAAAPAATRHLPGDGPPGNGYQAAGDVADLLPPVRYAPSRYVGPGQPQAGQERADPAANAAAAGPPAPRRRRLLALAAFVIAVGISVILPVAGTIAVLAVIAVLRACDRAHSRLAVRRDAWGPRATDVLVVALSAPWTLVRSIVVTVLVTPLLLFIAGVVAVAAIMVMRGSQLPVVGAYAAGVFTALNCLGPGSSGPRRQLNRVFNAMVPTRLAGAAATIILSALAAALVSLVMIKAPVYWPVPGARSVFGHVPGAGFFHGTVLRLRHVWPSPD